MYRCRVCSKNFDSQHNLDSHLGSRKHARRELAQPTQQSRSLICSPTQFRCCDCDRDFVNEVALLRHLRDKVHNLKPRPAVKNFACDLCGKEFATKNSVKQHRASVLHKPLCMPLSCIGSQECRKVFTSPSSMIHHLESGACVSGLTRRRINEIITSQDTNRLISSQLAIEAAETPDNSWIILTPQSSKCSVGSWDYLSAGSEMSSAEMDTPEASITGVSSEGTQEAPRRSWFFCPLCPPKSNRFRTAQDLEKHSTSPAHAPKIFHCPTALLSGRRQGPGKKFSTLSGVSMHIESGACVGGKKMIKMVLGFVNERLNELGFRQISLLG